MPPSARRPPRAATVVAAVAIAATAVLATAGGLPAPTAGAAATLAPGSTTTLTYCTEGGVRLAMTVFEPPEARRPAPAVLQVHGGGWEVGHRIEVASASPALEGLLSAGFVVASIGYRLAPAWRWPAQIRDTACALRFLRARARSLGIDPGRIGAWGESAGGQLVSLLGTDGNDPAWASPPWPGESARPNAVVDGFGPADLAARDWGRYLRTIIRTVFGPPGPGRRAVLDGASPVDHVAAGDPPFLILQGTADRLVPAAQSEAFAARLSAAGVPVRLVLVRGGGHGLRTPGEVPSASWLAGATVHFFVRTLGRARPGASGLRRASAAR